MGIYIYSVRTTSANIEFQGQSHTAYALSYLSRSAPPSDRERNWSADECAHNRRLMAAADSTWSRRGVTSLKGMLVFLSDKKPQEGNPVVEYAHETPCCYDCDSFGKTIGWLKRQGRRWIVMPAMWTVTFTLPESRCWDSATERAFFSAGEAIGHAKTVPPGRSARINVSRVSRTAYDHIGAPDPETTQKIRTVLLGGPWPETIWANAGLTPTADLMLSEGQLELYRDTEAAGGDLNYKLTNWVNVVEAAYQSLEAPPSAVDYDLKGDEIICTVQSVGQFTGPSLYTVAQKIQDAGRAGLRFSMA